MGGTDEPSNLVELTVEEHSEAHRMMYELYGRWQDELAWKTLSGQISISEASYLAWKEGCRKGGAAPKPPLNDIARENKRKAKLAEKNPMFGKTLSDEHKKKLSILNGGENNPMFGKKHPDNMRAYLSEQRKLRYKNGSKEGHYGSHSDETKEKLRQANKAQYADPVKKERHRQAMIEWAAKRKKEVV